MYVPAFPERMDRVRLEAIANANTILEWARVSFDSRSAMVGIDSKRYLRNYDEVEMQGVTVFHRKLRNHAWILVDPLIHTLDQIELVAALVLLHFNNPMVIVWVISPNR